MSEISKKIKDLVDVLPEDEQALVFEIVKRMVLAWDADFTKLTDEERDLLVKAGEEIVKGETEKHSEINWNFKNE